jgi:cysteine desulfurase
MSRKKRIYLDNNADTPLATEVLEAMRPWLAENFGNAASVHWYGQRARAALENARRNVAELLGAASSEIVFTSGGTEADNLAVLGAARAMQSRGRHVVTLSIEHPGVLSPCRVLEHEGFEVTYLGVDREGQFKAEDLKGALRPNTVLVSLMMANNETGTIQQVREAVQLAKPRGILVHSDAVQALAKIPVRVEELGVDLLSLSGHKIHGPQGIGALFVRKGVDLDPLLVGGGQERKRRAGTENVAAAVGLGCAAKMAARDVIQQSPRIASLRDRFEQEILSQCPHVHVNGHRECRVPNTTNLGFEGVEGETLLMALDMEGVAASLGAACSSGTLEPSHVLKAMRVPETVLRGSLRFSLSKYNTEEEIDLAAEIVCRVVDRIRSVSAHKGR